MFFRGSSGETHSTSIEGPPCRPLLPAKAMTKIDEAPAGSSSNHQTLPGDRFAHRSLAVPPPRDYFASKSVKSLALEQRISSICRASISALVLSDSIFDASGCCLSSSAIRSLNEASSRQRRSISPLTDPSAFQALCAGMMRPLLSSRLREPDSWPELEALVARIRSAAGTAVSDNQNFTRLPTQISDYKLTSARRSIATERSWPSSLRRCPIEGARAHLWRGSHRPSSRQRRSRYRGGPSTGAVPSHNDAENRVRGFIPNGGRARTAKA
jgi:hypothetical protein